MLKTPVGLSLYFLARHEPGFDPDAHLPLLADHGIGCVEVAPVAFALLDDDVGVRQMRRASERAGVAVNSIHTPFGGDLDLSSHHPTTREAGLAHARWCLERLRGLGGRFLIVHASAEPVEDAERATRMALCQDSLQRLVDDVGPHEGIQIAVETLPRSCLGHDSAEMLELLSPLDPRRVAVCLDANHANLREDLLEATRKLGHRIVTTHVSDNDGVDERHWLPGKGIVPWKAWSSALLATGYDGPFLYEVNWDQAGGAGASLDARLEAVRANAEALLLTPTDE